MPYLKIKKKKTDMAKEENGRPCTNCGIRKFYSSNFDMHFSGEDCPYYCKEYDNWKDGDGE